MDEVIRQIFTADDYTWSIAVVLTLCAATIVHAMLASRLLTVVYAPVLLTGALAGAWAMRNFVLLSDADSTIGVIIGAAAGMTIILVPMIFATRLFGVLRDLLVRPPKHGDIYIRSAPPKKPVAVDRTV